MAAGPSIEHSTMRTPARGRGLAMAGDSSGGGRTRLRAASGSRPRCNGRRPRVRRYVHAATPDHRRRRLRQHPRRWHTLAERVLAPARHAATGHIGLRPARAGIATPPFDRRTIAVDGSRPRRRRRGHRPTRRPSRRSAPRPRSSAWPPDADTGVYTATTPTDPTTPLPVDAGAAAALAAWFAFGDAVLGAWADDARRRAPRPRSSCGPSTSTSAPISVPTTPGVPTTARRRATPTIRCPTSTSGRGSRATTRSGTPAPTPASAYEALAARDDPAAVAADVLPPRPRRGGRRKVLTV